LLRGEPSGFVEGDHVFPAAGQALLHPVHPGAMRLDVVTPRDLIRGINCILVQLYPVVEGQSLGAQRQIWQQLPLLNDCPFLLPVDERIGPTIRSRQPNVEMIGGVCGTIGRPPHQGALNERRLWVWANDVNEPFMRTPRHERCQQE
jgi:hypothetical protein